VNIKWQKETYKDVDLDLNESPVVFKSQIYTLTNVPPERQKLMIKGTTIKDETEWGKLGLKSGATFMLMGTSDPLLAQPTTKTVFVEDLAPEKDLGHPGGLVNLGNTCYLNSTIQYLRAVPELRQSLTQWRPTANSNDAGITTTGAFRKLIADMENSATAVMPLEFLLLFRSAFPQFAQQENGKYMQQDAEEAFTQLMWCLKKLTNATNQNSNVITELFEGEYQSTMKCLDAPDEPVTHSSEKFEKLPCHITEAVNFLYDGLKQGLEEKIEKNSPTLQHTANYLKTFRISKLPFYLNVQFVRFFWKQQAKTKSKILRKVEFPFVLDIFDLCTDELKAKLQPERDRINKSKLEGTELQVDHSIRENRTGMYELIGVLSHKGRAADSGHYVAWVRQSQDENDWLLYDDDKVSAVNREDIGKLTGALGDWHIAYLLLYRAKNY
jgi:ubiquitin carboxyl-terminal hydrolase 14